jgi:hypothetical protein
MTTRHTQSETHPTKVKGIAGITTASAGIGAVYADHPVDFMIPVNRDELLECFAAELTAAAYRVALLAKTQATWLDLELDLWSALADTVTTWGRELGRCQ